MSDLKVVKVQGSDAIKIVQVGVVGAAVTQAAAARAVAAAEQVEGALDAVAAAAEQVTGDAQVATDKATAAAASAQLASDKAAAAAASATAAADATPKAAAALASANAAAGSATAANDAKVAAEGFKNTAGTKAQEATDAKVAAEGFKNTAATKAQEAADSATLASQKQALIAGAVSGASTSAQTATDAATAATSAKNAAEGFKNSAEAAKNTATGAADAANNSANGAGQSATAATAAKNAAEAAATTAGQKATQAGDAAAAAGTSASQALQHKNDSKASADAAQAAATISSTAAAGVASGAASALGSKNSAEVAAQAALQNIAGLNTALQVLLNAGTTAQNAASAARTYTEVLAAIASQDVVGTGGASVGLHRGPGAVTSVGHIDPSKDTNPQWPQQCADHSWTNRPLNGTWIPHSVMGNTGAGIPSELIARSYGGTLTELLSNTTFDTATGWGVQAGAVIANGKLFLDATANSRVDDTSNTLIAPYATGTVLEVTVVISAVTGTAQGFSVLGKTDGVGYNQVWFSPTGGNATVGTHVVRVVTTGNGITAPGARVIKSSGAGGTVTVDSVSIKRVDLPAHGNAGGYYQLATDGKFYRLFKNLINYSEQFDNAAWGKSSGLTITANAVIAPDGATTADKIVEAPAGSGSVGQQINSVATQFYAGQQYTISLYVKAGERNFGRFVSGSTTIFDPSASIFDATAGTVTGGTGAAITLDKNGFYRCSVTFTALTSGVTPVYWRMGNSSSPTAYTGDGASGMYAWGFDVAYGPLAAYEAKTDATTSQSETFDGNSNVFGRMERVLDGGRMVLYALDLPGRPMWMVFTASATAHWWRSATTITCAEYKEGKLYVGSSAGGYRVIDFANDKFGFAAAAASTNPNGNIAQRNADIAWYGNSLPPIANATVNNIAMTTMPDAPVDPMTGLQVPTIALATGGGISIIQNDGTVRNSAITTSYGSVALTPYALHAGKDGSGSSNGAYALNPGSLGASFALSVIPVGMFDPNQSNYGVVLAGRSIVGRLEYNSNVFRAHRFNEANPNAGQSFAISSTYNTGWMGVAVRCWLADVSVGTVVGGELITVAADRDLSSDTGFWTKDTSVTISGGTVNWTGVSGMALYRNSFLIPGRSYTITFTLTSRTAGGVQPVAGGIFGTIRTVPGTYSETIVCGSGALYSGLICSGGTTASADDISITEIIPDRSYKAKPLTINGTLTKALVGGVTGYSGWSATNYLQEAYSADHDGTTLLQGFGFVLPAVAGVNLASFTQDLTNPVWAKNGTIVVTADDIAEPDGFKTADKLVFNAADNDLRWSTSHARSTGQVHSMYVKGTAGETLWYGLAGATGAGQSNTIVLDGNWQRIQCVWSGAGATTGGLSIGTWAAATARTVWAWGYQVEVGAAPTAYRAVNALAYYAGDRSAAAGAGYAYGSDSAGRVFGRVWDGTTLREVGTTAVYATGQPCVAYMSYASSGTLTLFVNGKPVASTTGNPLGSFANASAVYTVGNRRTLDAAWPGSLFFIKPGLTQQSADAISAMYEDEKQMLATGAQVTLGDSGALVDLDYDAALKKWKTASAANRCSFVGLVRTECTASPAGNYTRIAVRDGIEIFARNTTYPGADIFVPPQGSVKAADRSRQTACLDWLGGFTANIPGSGDTSAWSNPYPTSLSYPTGSTLAGARISATQFPANTSISYFNPAPGSLTSFMSALPTASATGAAISFLDFILPLGYEVEHVLVDGVEKQEGSNKIWTRTFDGFRETVRFASAPGATAWVHVDARKALQ